MNTNDAKLSRDSVSRDDALRVVSRQRDQEARAKREDKKLDNNLREDPVVRNARDIMLSKSQSTADRMAIGKAFNDPKSAAPDMRQRMNEALAQSQLAKTSDAAKRAEAMLSAQTADRIARLQQLEAKYQKNTTTPTITASQYKDVLDTQNALVVRSQTLENQLANLAGVTETGLTQFAVNIERPVNSSAGQPRRAVLSVKYCGEWTVGYKPKDITHGLVTTRKATELTIRKGYFQYGPYRSIEVNDYTISEIPAPAPGDPETAGDYIIVAKAGFYPGFPTCRALPVARITNHDDEVIIAYATVTKDSDDNRVWSKLKQVQFGSISRTVIDYTFRHRMLTDTSVRIYAGTVRIEGRGNYEVATTDVALSGSTPFVSVEFDRVVGTAGIIMANSKPVSDGGFLRVPLLSFTAVAGVYANPIVCHIGDVSSDTAA